VLKVCVVADSCTVVNIAFVLGGVLVLKVCLFADSCTVVTMGRCVSWDF